MTLTPCDACCAIRGNELKETYQQNLRITLCDIAASTAASGTFASTGTFAAVSVTGATTLAAADTTRVAVSIVNTDATNKLLVAYGFTPTTTHYSYSIPVGGSLEVPTRYAQLAINGIASAGTVVANVTKGT